MQCLNAAIHFVFFCCLLFLIEYSSNMSGRKKFSPKEVEIAIETKKRNPSANEKPDQMPTRRASIPNTMQRLMKKPMSIKSPPQDLAKMLPDRAAFK